MPDGKPAGVRCVQLDDNNLCKIFFHPERPKGCAGFSAEPDICGSNAEEAMANLIELVNLTCIDVK
jgi:hypothetical protein